MPHRFVQGTAYITNIVNDVVKEISGTILAGNNFVDVAHGLGSKPTGYSITPTSDDGTGVLKVVDASTDATNIRIALGMGMLASVNITFKGLVRK